MLNDKARASLEQVLEVFRSGNLPEKIAHTLLPGYDRPCLKWSLTNQLLTMIMSEAFDARGFRQWQEVGRQVKKGARAFYILAPMLVRKEDTEEKKLIGFRGQPVFRFEDTEGDPLPELQVEPPQPPPLFERAEELGVKVRYVPGGTDHLWGAFSPGRQEIRLATHDEDVFFHELAHAAHHCFQPLKGGQQPLQEIIAELSAATLMRYCSLIPTEGRAYPYIEHYARKAGLEPLNACFQVLHQVEKVLGLILNREEKAAVAA